MNSITEQIAAEFVLSVQNTVKGFDEWICDESKIQYAIKNTQIHGAMRQILAQREWKFAIREVLIHVLVQLLFDMCVTIQERRIIGESRDTLDALFCKLEGELGDQDLKSEFISQLLDAGIRT